MRKVEGWLQSGFRHFVIVFPGPVSWSIASSRCCYLRSAAQASSEKGPRRHRPSP
jgi:hypothetical protein